LRASETPKALLSVLFRANKFTAANSRSASPLEVARRFVRASCAHRPSRRLSLSSVVGLKRRPRHSAATAGQRRKGLSESTQYEVLGNDAKGHVRPWRDDRNVRLWFRTPLSDCQHRSIAPFLLRPAVARRANAAARLRRTGRDGEVFKNAYPALRTGLLSLDPCGTDSLRPVQS
jgi:hypothetical protein